MVAKQPVVQVRGFDHLVLRVRDAERSLRWYVDELGLEPERDEEWRQGEVPFPSVRVDARTIIDLLPSADVSRPDGDRRNVDHLCLVVDEVDLTAVCESGRFEVVGGPGRRFGAQQEGTSIYVLDPDANLVELRHYGVG